MAYNKAKKKKVTWKKQIGYKKWFDFNCPHCNKKMTFGMMSIPTKKFKVIAYG